VLGIRTVAELAAAPGGKLEQAFGPRLGQSIAARARGRDDRQLETSREPKSESRETTFATDVADARVLESTLERLVDDLCRGLQASRCRGRTVTLKIRLRPFRTYTRSRTIEGATRDRAVVGAVARELLAAFERDAPVRLLGVGLGALTRDAEEAEAGQERLDLAI
jgi:DNA polymerase-4